MTNPLQNEINRRRFITSASVLAAGFWISPKTLLAQTPKPSPVTGFLTAAKTAKINITKLRGNVSMLEGSGGNISVLHGHEGKLLVDGGIGFSRHNILNALNTISADPLKYLINSHWHFDHTFGNEWLHQAGATIIAQDITRRHLMHTTRVEDWQYTFQPLPKGALPTVIFKTDHDLDFNGEVIHTSAYKPAHTDGDSSIHFRNADILHVADTFWNGHYPFIDYSTGGSIDGMILAAQQNVNKVGPKTIVIPGHGPIGNKRQLIEFYTMLSDIRQKVARLKKQGHSLKEVVALKPTSAYDTKYGSYVIDGATFTYLVYKGV